MSAKSILTASILLPGLFLTQGTRAATWYVSASVSSSGDGTSWATAFKKIQEGIDATSDGDTVIVAEGTYFEKVNFNGKNIILTSTDPLNPAVVANTIIDGNGTEFPAEEAVVNFEGSEGETCVLTGFTIRNGHGWEGGGIAGHRCHATIENNVICENKGVGGGGLSGCHGVIRNNRICGNLALPGGSYDRPTSYGGGLGDCDGTIENNLIYNNSGERGGGLSHCDGLIRNNTIYQNHGDDGAGLYGCDGIILNCIIWRNWGGGQLSNSSLPSYSCIEDWRSGGEGNISRFPYFADVRNDDYHLKSWSPCIDAGDPSSPLSEEPQPNGARINMGAYGNTCEATSASADSDSDQLPDDWEIEFFGGLAEEAEGDPDADLMPNIEEYHGGFNPTAPQVWYVDGTVEESGDRRSWEKALKTIQERIEAAKSGETVVVAEGVYVESIHFQGKNIVLRGTDPLDASVVTNTVIDGNQADSVVVFAGDEDERCVLSGFTIRNGSAQYGGGILGSNWFGSTHATVRNNVIAGNSASQSGGGLYGCNGEIANNTITDNWAEFGGGGLGSCDGVIQNNIISENSCDRDGAGLKYCDGIIQNNTIVGNSGAWGVGGLFHCGATMGNCIIWDNSPWDAGQLAESSEPAYCCIESWAAGGEGNIRSDPYFVYAANGDFHLRPWSPCIDAGDPTSPFSNELEPNGGRVNMGAYGNTLEAASKSTDVDADGLPDDWELHWFGGFEEAGAGDLDADGIPNEVEYGYGWNPVVQAGSRVENRTKGKWYEMIQPALMEAEKGDEVVVYPGTYAENIRFEGKNLVLKSTDPLNAEVVPATVIDGGRRGPVVTFSGTEDETCVLSGLTLRNGRGYSGGGVCGGDWGKHCRAIVENNVISGNSVWYYGAGVGYCDGTIRGNTICNNSLGRAGGLGYCNGTIENNVIRDNTSWSGGGLYRCTGIIRNNIITGNSGNAGGGLADCSGTIEGNIVTGNIAELTSNGYYGIGGGLYGCSGIIADNVISDNVCDCDGGGLSSCNGILQNNTISGNSAGGEGGGLWRCEGTIQNNLICGNHAGEDGGALRGCAGTIENCTIAGNSAGRDVGGLYACYAVIRNCIISGNTATRYGYQVYESRDPTFSCIQDWSGGGKGNSDAAPLFLDEEGGDYHLQPGSPGIDSGVSYLWLVWPQRDLDGNCRLVGKGIDMGCYEHGASLDSDGDFLSDEDEVTAGTDAEEEDTDGDGLRDGLEILRGSDLLVPTSPETIHVPYDMPTIQQALCLAVNGDEIVPIPGNHFGTFYFCGADVVLRSLDPENPEVVNSTILDGEGLGPVITLTGNESEACEVAGLTIRNGNGPRGGGICGGTEENPTHATIRNNWIVGNKAGYGGGICYCLGKIANNAIAGNWAYGGGGLSDCDGEIVSNTISENEATYNGGASSECDGIIHRNVIVGNSAGRDGGGLSWCYGTIRNNLIVGNSADKAGGGVRLRRDARE